MAIVHGSCMRRETRGPIPSAEPSATAILVTRLEKLVESSTGRRVVPGTDMDSSIWYFAYMAHGNVNSAENLMEVAMKQRGRH